MSPSLKGNCYIAAINNGSFENLKNASYLLSKSNIKIITFSLTQKRLLLKRFLYLQLEGIGILESILGHKL